MQNHLTSSASPLMLVPVMKVGEMRMGMHQARMRMPVRVRLA